MVEEPDRRLHDTVERQAERERRARAERTTLLAHTVFLGTLGILFVLPVVLLAYLGNWIDDQHSGYSVRWTVSLILLGVVLGGYNVYRYIREHP
ncbi:MAG: AtpZ/AtpI family protein [Nevskiales bacterium]|nr:AtpZ/AtpI family protein [Nevskiales bacterium]